jgi:hypothetical protein
MGKLDEKVAIRNGRSTRPRKGLCQAARRIGG